MTKQKQNNPDKLMYFDRDIIHAFQNVKLRQVLDQAWSEIEFYRALWVERGNELYNRPASFSEWPLWNVADLRTAMNSHPPFGNLYVKGSLEDIRFIHSSSGTTGKPRYTAFTGLDEPEVYRAYGRVGRMIGLTSDDVFCETGGYGLPIAAWSYTRMAQAVGATVVPAGSGKITPSDKLIDIIHDVGVTAIEGAPSYLLHVGRAAQTSSRSLINSKVRLLSLGGEPASPAVRAELKKLWGDIHITQTYANSDVSWVAGECWASSQNGGATGMHILEDLVYAEILDENGDMCPDGAYGELVLTSWLRPSTPRIRFRTGDRAAIDHAPCECGRTSARLLPIAGRTDDAVRYQGITIWPSAVEDILTEQTGGRREFYLKLEQNPETGSNQLSLVVERFLNEQELNVENLEKTMRTKLNVKIPVITTAPGTTVDVTGLGYRAKTRRFIDVTDNSEKTSR